MLLLRRVRVVLLGALAGSWIAALVFGVALGIEATRAIVIVVIAAALGGLAGLPEARRVEAYSAQERRDALLGSIFFAGLIAAAGCLLLAFPWDALAAIAVLVGTATAMRRVRPLGVDASA